MSLVLSVISLGNVVDHCLLSILSYYYFQNNHNFLQVTLKMGSVDISPSKDVMERVIRPSSEI